MSSVREKLHEITQKAQTKKSINYKENVYSKNTSNNQDEERILTKKSGHMCMCN